MATVTVQSLITQVRALLRDNAGQTNNEWTDSNLFAYLTDGVGEAQRELSLNDADFFETSVPFNVTNGTHTYTPATDIRKVVQLHGLYVDPPDLIPAIPWSQTYRFEGVEWSGGRGTVAYKMIGNSIRIFPTPNVNITNAFRLLYEQQIVPVGGYTTTTTQVTMPDDWLRYVVYATTEFALLQDEQDPAVISRKKNALAKRLRADYRDREKGDAAYVIRDEQGGGDDYWWMG